MEGGMKADTCQTGALILTGTVSNLLLSKLHRQLWCLGTWELSWKKIDSLVTAAGVTVSHSVQSNRATRNDVRCFLFLESNDATGGEKQRERGATGQGRGEARGEATCGARDQGRGA